MNKFKPKYDWKLWLAFPFFGVAIPLVGLEIWSSPLSQPMLFVSVLLLTLALIYVPFVLIRSIEFDDEKLSINYYLRPSKKILFRDIQDVGNKILKTKSSSIVIGFENSLEFQELIISKLKIDQLTNEVVIAEQVNIKTSLQSILVFIVAYVVSFFFYLPNGWYELTVLFIWVIVFTFLYKYNLKQAKSPYNKRFKVLSLKAS